MRRLHSPAPAASSSARDDMPALNATTTVCCCHAIDTYGRTYATALAALEYLQNPVLQQSNRWRYFQLTAPNRTKCSVILCGPQHHSTCIHFYLLRRLEPNFPGFDVKAIRWNVLFFLIVGFKLSFCQIEFVTETPPCLPALLVRNCHAAPPLRTSAAEVTRARDIQDQAHSYI